MEHTHGFTADGQGGHYHCDVTPNEVEYLGYFNLAESKLIYCAHFEFPGKFIFVFSAIYRIDPPETTHMIGRD